VILDDILARLITGFANQADEYVRFLDAAFKNPLPENIPLSEAYNHFRMLAGGGEALQLTSIMLPARTAMLLLKAAHDSGRLTSSDVEILTTYLEEIEMALAALRE
jgi:hypothetical protein